MRNSWISIVSFQSFSFLSKRSIKVVPAIHISPLSPSSMNTVTVASSTDSGLVAIIISPVTSSSIIVTSLPDESPTKTVLEVGSRCKLSLFHTLIECPLYCNPISAKEIVEL